MKKIRGYRVNLIVLGASCTEIRDEITETVYNILKDKNTNLRKGRHIIATLYEHQNELHAEEISVFKKCRQRDIIINCKP